MEKRSKECWTMKNYHAYFTRLSTWHRKGHWHSLSRCCVHDESDLDILLFRIHADVQNKLIIIMLWMELCTTCSSRISITSSTVKFHSAAVVVAFCCLLYFVSMSLNRRSSKGGRKQTQYNNHKLMMILMTFRSEKSHWKQHDGVKKRSGGNESVTNIIIWQFHLSFHYAMWKKKKK